MGGKNSTSRRNKETRVATDVARAEHVKAVMTNVTHVQNQIIQAAAVTAPTTITQTTAIVKNDVYLQQMMDATNVAQHQLARGGDSLVKDDMIPTVLFLKTVTSGESWFEKEKVDMVQSLTREDLVASVRTIVFDPIAIQKLLRLIAIAEATDTTAQYSGEVRTNGVMQQIHPGPQQSTALVPQSTVRAQPFVHSTGPTTQMLGSTETRLVEAHRPTETRLVEAHRPTETRLVEARRPTETRLIEARRPTETLVETRRPTEAQPSPAFTALFGKVRR